MYSHHIYFLSLSDTSLSIAHNSEVNVLKQITKYSFYLFMGKCADRETLAMRDILSDKPEITKKLRTHNTYIHFNL